MELLILLLVLSPAPRRYLARVWDDQNVSDIGGAYVLGFAAVSTIPHEDCRVAATSTRLKVVATNAKLIQTGGTIIQNKYSMEDGLEEL